MDIRILIADDSQDFASTLSEIVNSFGYKTYVANTPAETLMYLQENARNIGAALLDIEFGPHEELDGLDILERMRNDFPEIPVVMISGKGSIETAVRATKLGALNFIEKSIVSKSKIKAILDTAMERLGPRGEVDEIKKFLASEGIIAKSKAMMEIGDSIIRYGRTNLNVLITGDTGTGKKLVAQAIHAASQRNSHQMVTVDIPNIPKELFQSELFGHVKGAFSGASESKKGLFHQANYGSIFLDEIGEMTLDLQSSLFIPIEEKIIRRVGSIKSEVVDIRFISATDRDLLAEMRDGTFREQLYHRLRECEIHLPSLAERKEDIPEIIEYYLHKHNEDFTEQKHFSSAALDLLVGNIWHGNVRELASVVRVALQTSLKDQVEAVDLTRILRNSPSYYQKDIPIDESTNLSLSRTLKEDLADVDKLRIISILEEVNGNVTKASGILGISRETMHNKIRRYDIDIQQYRKKTKRRR